LQRAVVPVVATAATKAATGRRQVAPDPPPAPCLIRDGKNADPYGSLSARSRHSNPARLIPGNRSSDFGRPASEHYAPSRAHFVLYNYLKLGQEIRLLL
jgi:hypothetical protein